MISVERFSNAKVGGTYLLGLPVFPEGTEGIILLFYYYSFITRGL